MSIEDGQGQVLGQDPAQELCQTRRGHGDAQPAGDPEELLSVVPGHRPARGVRGRGVHHGLCR